MRYFFEIGYDGSNYHGWQSQPNATSIQSEVEKNLQQLLGKKTPIVGSSRTDTGVHCVQQFFHLNLDGEWDKTLTLHRLNIMLPKDIVIRDIRQTKLDAHARYDAIQRCYEYRITTCKNPLLRHYAFHFFREADLQKMNQAATLLIGEHDFQAFSKVKTDVNHFICKLSKAQWRKQEELLVFTLTANRFLRGMVRTIVGSMLDVGTGKITQQDFKKIIDTKDRGQAGRSVPPQGLYLLNVEYPKNIFTN